MKRVITITLSAVMLLSCLTGCKQHEIPAQASEVPTAAPASSASYQTPERFTGSWTGVDGCINVTADAVVSGPGDSAIPVAKVKGRAFTLEDVELLKEALLQGNPLYHMPGVTREDTEEKLEYWRGLQDQLQNEQTLPDGKNEETVSYHIAYYEELLKTAPREGEKKPVTDFLTHPGGRSQLEGIAQVGEDEVYLSVRNTDANAEVTFFVCPYYPGGYRLSGDPIFTKRLEEGNVQTDVKLPLQEALQTGRELLDKLGLTDVVCDRAEPVAYIRFAEDGGPGVRVVDTGYELHFVRTVQGLPLSTVKTSSFFPEGNRAYSGFLNATATESGEQAWYMESISMEVSTKGIVSFSWRNPYEEPELVTGQAELLDFETVSQIFEKMIMVQNSKWTEINRKNGFDVINDLHVDSVNFTLMRIREKGNLSEGTIVPVWDFWGTEKAHAADEAHKDIVYGGTDYKPLLTINALDGSIIDRQLGY